MTLKLYTHRIFVRDFIEGHKNSMKCYFAPVIDDTTSTEVLIPSDQYNLEFSSPSEPTQFVIVSKQVERKVI
jgi:hypothetical protein